MICDDSSVMRRILNAVLSAEPDLQVVYQAEHGRDALDHLDSARPDIVIVDVEMPVLDGIDTVRAIRRRSRHLPIVMFSSLTSEGAAATFDALSAGANDFVTKPSGQLHIEDAIHTVRQGLVTKIHFLTELASTPSQGTVVVATRTATPASPLKLPRESAKRQTTMREATATSVTGNSAEPPPRSRSRQELVSESHRTEPGEASRHTSAPVRVSASSSRRRSKTAAVVAIGSSTGGPKALSEVLTRLPADFRAPVLVVQHMPKLFTAMMADRLDALCKLQVREAVHDAIVRPGEVWIAPGDFHMEVTRVGAGLRLKLNQGPPENAVRPAVDPLLRSVARCFGHMALGVILTGMGKDGLDGCRALSNVGAQIIAQDQATSAVWGMPRAVAEAGLASVILPLEQIGFEIEQRVRPVAAEQPVLTPAV